MKKVVITGATGMIGVTLIEYLTKKNIEVLAIIRENSKRKENIKENNLVKIIECNLENLHELNLIENNYDIFYHLGWDGTFGNDRMNIEKQQKNITYTLEAVNLAKRLGCKTFIGTGSQAEYGRVDGIICNNTVENPETEYGKAKLKAGIESRNLANSLESIFISFSVVYSPLNR